MKRAFSVFSSRRSRLAGLFRTRCRGCQDDQELLPVGGPEGAGWGGGQGGLAQQNRAASSELIFCRCSILINLSIYLGVGSFFFFLKKAGVRDQLYRNAVCALKKKKNQANLGSWWMSTTGCANEGRPLSWDEGSAPAPPSSSGSPGNPVWGSLLLFFCLATMISPPTPTMQHSSIGDLLTFALEIQTLSGGKFSVCNS